MFHMRVKRNFREGDEREHEFDEKADHRLGCYRRRGRRPGSDRSKGFYELAAWRDTFRR